MFWVHHRPISTLQSMIGFPILMGSLCLLFLSLLMRVGTQSCIAHETEKAHGKHVHFLPTTNWTRTPEPRIPSQSDCTCSFSVDACCRGATSNPPKKSHAFLTYRDNLPRLSLAQTTMIKPFESKPLRYRDRGFRDSNSFDQEEFFLVNCTFLI